MIYVSSSCIKKRNIATIILQLAENGITNIELSGGTDYYCGLEYDLKMLKEKYQLQYACHAYFPPPKEPFVVNLASCNDVIYKQSVEHYERCIEMLEHIECTTLSIHAGFIVEIKAGEIGGELSNKVVYDENKAYDRFCSAYQHILEQCSKKGINLYLENNVLNVENYIKFGCKNLLMMTDYESIIKMKKQMDFNLLLDLGHLHVSAHALGLDFKAECAKLKKYAKWLHLSENNKIFDEHKPLREGSEIMRLFSELYDIDENITLETVGSIDEILQSIQLVHRGYQGENNHGTQKDGMQP